MLCECGCEQPTRLAPQSVTRLGWVAGQPIRFINGHQNHEIHEAGYAEQDCGYETPCWIWKGGLTTAGYGQVCIGGNKQDYSHRIYWERANGPVPAGLELDHLCRQRACCNPSHLEPMTHLENIRRGARTKLTPARVGEIREMLSKGWSHRTIALIVGVGKTTIGSVATGKSWKDIL